MPLKALDYFLVSLQIVLFGAYLIPFEINLGIPIPELILWPAQIAMIVGILEIIWALRQLGRFLSPFPKPRKDAELITWGVFGLVRHPIYSGIVLFAAGLGLYQQDPYRVLIAGSLLAFFYLKSRYEEKNLLAYFPNYKAYREKTGRFFPKLFPTQPK